MSLTELAIGGEAEISHIDLDRPFKCRLDGMGVIKGSKIKTLRKGWGIKIYEVKGSWLAIRNEDAKKIIIK